MNVKNWRWTAAFAVLFAAFAAMLLSGVLTGIDEAAGAFVLSLRSDGMTAAMRAVTLLGGRVVLIGASAVLMLIPAARRRLAVPVVGCLALSTALNAAIKLLVRRDRPGFSQMVSETSFSFPSGHTMNSLAFYGALAMAAWLLCRRRTALLSVCACAVIVAAVAFSRIYLGVHYFSDTAGALPAGATVLAGAFPPLWAFSEKRLVRRRPKS